VESLVLLVMEKSRDIAILRTMGATSRVIRRIFVLQGIAIGLIGTTGGTIGGLIVCWVAEKYRLVKLPEDVYQIPYLPFHVCRSTSRSSSSRRFSCASLRRSIRRDRPGGSIPPKPCVINSHGVP
jgi:hypothetical protein